MAKRIMKPTINWVELEKRVPVEQKNNFYAFKAKSDAYWQRVLSNPAEMPKIDWDNYKKLVPDPSLVDKFKGELEKYKVPFPQDTLSSKIDEQWKTMEKDIQAFCKEYDVDIENANKELSRIRALPKFEDMTMEMYFDLFPKEALDSVNRPSFWPHDPEDQVCYDPDKKTGGH